MIADIEWHENRLKVDFSAGRSIAITLDPHGPQPSFFAGAPAQASALRIGDYIGDVARGGSCNAEVLEFVPHCHGTHTECRAHLDRSAGNVLDIIDQQPCLARLVTLQGTRAKNTTERYGVQQHDDEILLTRKELLALNLDSDIHGCGALIIRTMPNGEDKMTRDYAHEPFYPVLSNEAIELLAAQEFRHLLLDTPSLDRADDGGRLANHRCWWGMNGETANTGPTLGEDPRSRSVTEMIYVPEDLVDGYYWLHLELQPLAADATSSRPVLYPLEILTQ